MVSWSCIVYNPQSTKKYGRLRDIARTFQWNDFIALPGTQMRNRSSTDAYWVQSVGKHRFYHWGAGKGQFVNDSCGVSIGIKQRPFPARCVVNIFSPPSELQGRGGTLRIKRGDADITAIVVYVPTEPSSRDQRKASQQIWTWVHDLLSALPARTVPLLLLDANEKTGLRNNPVTNSHEYFEDGVIGSCDVALESYNGSLLHLCLLDHHLFAVNTFYETGPTWYGWTQEGLSSRIDYICLPCSLRCSVKSCRILQQAGDALQNMARPGRCDHRPLQVVFDYKLCFDTVSRPCWSREALAASLYGGPRREMFAQTIEACCTDSQHKWDPETMHPNQFWAQLQQIVHNAAQTNFAAKPRHHDLHTPTDTAEALQKRQDNNKQLVQMHRHSILPFGSCCGGSGCLQGMSELFHAWRLRAKYLQSDKHVRHLFQRDRRRWIAARVDEFQQSWHKRQFHAMWKLSRVLSGYKIGPKKRRYDIPTKCSPSAQEWVDYLARPGPEGGCSGAQIVW